MSGEDTFISRWSRLKRSAALGKEPQAEAARAEERLETGRGAGPSSRTRDDVPAKQVEAEPPFDPASLPPIESIVADTDIRAFLQRGVPAAVAKAALRRAWTTDPAIRDFIEVAENQWDFTDPAGIPGFGPLQTGDGVHQLVGQAMNELQEAPGDAGSPEEARNAAARAADDAGPEARASDTAPKEEKRSQDTADVAALQHTEPPPVTGAATRRRGHGGAMPR